jgi:hypothetical protein
VKKSRSGSKDHPTAIEDNSKFVRLLVPKIMMKLLGYGDILQYKGKWRISKQGIKKFGDLYAEA